MHKIIFIYFLILCSGLNVFAQGCSPLDPRCIKITSFNGSYMGTSVHQEFHRAKTSTQTNNETFDASVENKLSMKGTAGGLFVGVGATKSTLYSGIEGGGEISNASGNHSSSFVDGVNNAHQTNIRKTKTFFLMGRLGKQIKEDCLVYLKGGVSVSDYSFLFNLNSEINDLNLNKSENKRIIFPLIAFGVEFLAPKIFEGHEARIGIEYDYFFKKNISFNHMENTFKGASDIQLENDVLKIRLIYKI